jgi:hypothetical protein
VRTAHLTPRCELMIDLTASAIIFFAMLALNGCMGLLKYKTFSHNRADGPNSAER